MTRTVRRYLRESEYIQSALELCQRHTEKLTMDTVTIVLLRETAARVFNTRMDADARDEVRASLDGNSRQGDKVAVIQLTAEDAADWQEHLNSGQPVDAILGAKLRGAFAFALGAFVDPDPQWTFKE